MPTTDRPRGALAEYAIKDQPTYGVLASGDYTRTLAYSDTLSEEQGWVDDEVLGAPAHNGSDAVDPAPDLPKTEGGIVVPLDLSHVGHWLKGALGAPATSGSGNFTHVFGSGKAALPHRSIEKKVASGLYLQYDSAIVKTLAFELQRGPGFDRMTAGLLFRKETKAASSGAGTPAAMAARDPLVKWLPVMHIADVLVADVMSITAEFDNKAAANEALGDAEGYPVGHDVDDRATFTGSIRLRVSDATIYDLAKARAAIANVKFIWAKSGTRSLTLAPAALYLTPTGMPISGAGKIEQTYAFRCAQASNAPMLTATLKNAVASY